MRAGKTAPNDLIYLVVRLYSAISWDSIFAAMRYLKATGFIARKVVKSSR